MPNILIIDDSDAVRGALETLFQWQGYQVICADSPARALQHLKTNSIDLILQDMNFTKGEMHGAQGKNLFYQLREQHPDVPIILMTAWTSLDMVVELIKAGAIDYIAKPWDDQRLITTVANTLKLKVLQDQQRLSERQQQERHASFVNKDLCGLIFVSTAMEQLLQMAIQLAPSNAAVLITGENGTGKEGVAHVLHINSNRRAKPFIKVNMGALPADLIEAELFGAEPGAYTGLTKVRIGRFEAADGGTLFLDEIGNLPLSGQIKLLRVLQTGEFERLGSSVTRKVDVRLLSATNADLPNAISAGEFRQDLYYRINVVELKIQPLAKRRDDILPLAKHFLAGQKNLSRAAEQKMLDYAWPGNVRELQNVCQRALLLSNGDAIEIEDLLLQNHKSSIVELTVSGANKNRALDDIDQQTLKRVLAQHQGIVSRAAKELGITRQALYRRMEFYGLAKI
ncbi:sigma-54-dependent Fis family transcriptional regulator [Cellvibrio zantedeschiae]|uniref:Sigma-54-dependent Fis family transcriptional regulator n=1 Tax=Cellvibrio zantedeschiae TaxID=1237077 RepID=A0ABQ3B858_9GAMM|nr:sigma-54 dependent transcriptional regulator [Cellvibrio zantedeschiae]GGY79966.1 sigma-54-dependent Fis family transcriptional regulator [Cellvibrio zantedeschiae]